HSGNNDLEITTRHKYMRIMAVAVLMQGILVQSILMQGIGSAAPADPAPQEVWTFDRIDKIGGHSTTLLGHPHVIDTPLGKAVEFNGVDDGLMSAVHQLAGAETFTWEGRFRPDGCSGESRGSHTAGRPAT